jgi:hypothetical protein
MRGRIGTFLTFILFFTGAFAQTYSVEGILVDSATRQPLIGVNVALTSVRDSTAKHYAATDVNGKFTLRDVAPGGYSLLTSYIGYFQLNKTVRVNDNVQLGTMQVVENVLNLKGAEIVERIPPVQVKGDTTEFNAQGYKTNPDATAEDLVKKMPGITVTNGQVQAQGEEVKKVLVDGKEFFGDDPTLALKTLPADMIDKVQVYDRASDQAAFTGVDDGNQSKTINIVTRKDRREGVFGKVYGAYGTQDRFNAGGNLNIMKKAHRLSFVGMSNNINQQNFSGQDLLGLAGGSSGGGGGRGGMGAASNFMVGQQSGVSTTHSYGLNYTGDITKKINLTGSYFLNNSNTENNQTLNRTYFLGGDSTQLYSETSVNNTQNFNHRLNFRMVYNIDSSNSIIFTPKLSFQTNNSDKKVQGVNQLQSEQKLSDLLNTNGSKQNGYDYSSDLLIRHKFNKQGRTISLNLTTGVNNKTGNTSLYSSNNYYGSTFITQLINQEGTTKTSGNNYGARLIYTEPVGKKGIFELSYDPSVTYSKTSKETYNVVTGNLDSNLSNGFNSTYTTQRAGVEYTYNISEGSNIGVEMQYQEAKLQAAQTFPAQNTINRPFNNFLPGVSFRYKFTEKSNIRVRYRTRTNAPSVGQLQNLTNNSNPLQLSTGNPNLVQEYTHFVFSRLMVAKPQKGRNTFILFIGQTTQNYIGKSTTIATADTTVNGIGLRRGSQLTMPVNLNGYVNIRSFFMYSLPVKFIKSNINNMSGITYSRTPSLINNSQNFSNATTLTEGITIGSNISKEIDFTVSYSANYNVVKNTIRPELDNNYFFHTAGAKLNWIFLKSIVLQTEATQTLYSGLSGGYNQNYLLWNAAIGKKFLKGNAGELKISVFDLLNQNNSISRTVTETYLEDTRSQVLNRYFMITFTYTFKKFKKGTLNTDTEPDQPEHMPFMRPPGAPPGGRPPH